MSRTLVHQFAVKIPAGTTEAAPLVTSTVFPPNRVESVRWLFPGGCNGLVGIQIGARSVPVLPHTRGTWFINSGAAHGISVRDLHVTGDWSVIGYNTGAHDHTVHVTFVVYREERPAEPFALIRPEDISQFPTFGRVRYD